MSYPHRSSPVSAFPPEKLKVAVLMGGISREREISIESGTCVADALKEAGVKVVLADIKSHL
jgi:D-alanine-D-alanine ligase-like ATP-grasp enzyme